MARSKAEYIWIDGHRPRPLLRSKTRILPSDEREPPVWGFDGSSTNQAEGSNSDQVLKPVYTVQDPVRGPGHTLSLCEVLTMEMEPHETNTRAACREAAERYGHHDAWYGMEQEYTFFQGVKPLGWPDNGFPGPQGPYYCGVGADEVHGRPIVERHMDACLEAGLAFAGINAEVMPGQWEYQIGPVGPLELGDEIWLSRYLLYRIAEEWDVAATLDPKPVKGDWNGAGAHTNFSTKEMRDAWDPCMAAIEALRDNHWHHIENYGAGIESRLTGEHETCSYKEFRWGVADRGASVRIPWQVERDGKGYIEDRRPNANCDPYVVSQLMLETVCRKLEG